MTQYKKSLFWCRRDLRIFDNAALYHALKNSEGVVFIFVFDLTILSKLSAYDRRIEFIVHSLFEIKSALKSYGSNLFVVSGDPLFEVPRLAHYFNAQAVFANDDYEPQAIARDFSIEKELTSNGVSFHLFKDQVIFEKFEIVNENKASYSVFSQYKNAWLNKLRDKSDFYFKPYPVDSYCHHFFKSMIPPSEIENSVDFTDVDNVLKQIGFSKTNLLSLGIKPGMSGGYATLIDFSNRINAYDITRNFPASKGPSYLSVHLRFGTVSIRDLVKFTLDAHSQSKKQDCLVWLNELIWRDFYFMLLFHHPHVVDQPFNKFYSHLVWEEGASAEFMFKAWCDGKTGYPIVDAAIRQLNTTGYMHNRLRMIAASFLVKDLGIDWQKGEAYFAMKLNDYDLAANNGGWQWSASTGCDAQPYLRHFNPVTQSKNFDADARFIKRYLPELKNLPSEYCHEPNVAPEAILTSLGITLGVTYPRPIVDHKEAIIKTKQRYTCH